MTQRDPIGGFFALDLDVLGQNPEQSLWEYWKTGAKTYLSFYNARSALFALLKHVQPVRLWLPSYICADILDAPQKAETEVSFYPANPINKVDTEFLDEHVQDGDMVVYLRYFGCATSRTFLEFMKTRTDVIWVEDNCQAIDLVPENNVDWIINSARKICGVSDGGFLISHTHEMPEPKYEGRSEIEHILPAFLRRDNQESDFYGAYKKSESLMDAGYIDISRTSEAILKALPYTDIAVKRQENARHLADALNQSQNFEILDFGHVPFALPLYSEKAIALQSYLADHQIFCARHWPELASAQNDWAESWSMAQNLLSLPCDQRYGREQMDFIAEHVNRFFENEEIT